MTHVIWKPKHLIKPPKDFKIDYAHLFPRNPAHCRMVAGKICVTIFRCAGVWGKGVQSQS